MRRFNIWDIRGFGYETLGEVLQEILGLRQTKPYYEDNIVSMPYVRGKKREKEQKQWVRLAPVSLYSVDNIVRRAQALQETQDANWQIVKVHPQAAKAQGLSEGQKVWVTQEGKKSNQPLPIIFSELIPMHAAWVPSSVEATRTLGMPFGLIELIPA